MIASDGSYHVSFLGSDGKPFLSKPVVAWDDDGNALVAGKLGLVRADRFGTVHRIVQHDAAVVSAVPGGGWMIDCTGDDGDTWTDVIVAWTIHSDGSATALTCSADGLTGDATEGLAEYRIYHPSQSFSEGEPDALASSSEPDAPAA
ncbi:hypothetical protein [Streptomyces caniscabiei]|uniref:Uncharacterized protein n=1 Tax=Streptomyces caniscabiei TaxID=2746961 RepID=A0ABU4MZM2_9ACTN|nr:hypothetical protein [Streptomyces caniscabiei]MBE4790262.1 hypothetical protein [Streptomyces caniscabiei]MBE4799509.1 hypothetical protein [Streptomyces caniscabiei]MDX3015119.1 hypothetical protein [Streptomyces caniscabiei]MDX3042562.1 hypothetical protein [Streptomyces caniscabiei]